jgi:hypothetical protein
VIVRDDGSVMRCEVPAGGKVTFGPLTPGGRDARGYQNGNHLRIYTGTVQLAVFPSVRQFWSEDLNLEKLAVGDDNEFAWRAVRPEDPMLEAAANLMEHKGRKAQPCQNCGWV